MKVERELSKNTQSEVFLMDSRKTYTDEFKREAVRLAIERGNVAETARDLGIADNLLYRWMKRQQTTRIGEVAFPGQGNARDAELARLKKELARVQMENAILKKAVGIFTKDKP